jgi:Nickel responsive protein SCO4226-like
MKKFVIERDIPAVGKMTDPELSGAASASNKALAELAPRIQWQHSYVTAEKTFCIYLAEDEEAIRKHSELSGFPASIITEVTSIIDPTTAK